MALYRQQSGIQNQLDYIINSNNDAGDSDHVSVGVRGVQHKQPRYHRRLGHSKQRILIGTVIIILCFVLVASAYAFLSRDRSPGIRIKTTQVYSFRDDFLANVSRIDATAQRKFPSLTCDMKLLNSTAQLVEPPENSKFARFSLSYTEREEKPDGVDLWEPRFAGHQSLREREDSFLARDQKINCGFVKGPKEYPSTGFDFAEEDYRYISKCHIAVVSCIFGNHDRLKSPFKNVISHMSRKTVCFVMFLDEKTLRAIGLEGQIPDRRGFIGIWKIVVVNNLPSTDMRRVGKIPKLLPHRLFPSARYSIWVDSKLRLQRDPLLILERFLWRKGNEYAISNHYVRHCVWEEVERNKVLNKFNHTMLDQQLQFYEADGLKRFNASDPEKLLPSNVPEASVIIREHTPMSNLFSCLWYNEVDRFTSRDQLSFTYTYQKLLKKNPGKKFYLDMFKDCERRQISKLFSHRPKDKRSSSQDANGNPWQILNNLSKEAKESFYNNFLSHKDLIHNF